MSTSQPGEGAVANFCNRETGKHENINLVVSKKSKFRSDQIFVKNSKFSNLQKQHLLSRSCGKNKERPFIQQFVFFNQVVKPEASDILKHFQSVPVTDQKCTALNNFLKIE